MYRIGYLTELMELASCYNVSLSTVSLDLEDITNQLAIGGVL